MGLKLSKVSYQDKIKDISYEFEDGKITSVISSSGGGKTLFSYLLIGFLKAEGEIDNPYVGRELGYVFQRPDEAFIFSSVREEIAFGLKKYNYKLEVLDKRIEDALSMVGLPKKVLDKSPFSLSSGEKELLALGVTLSLNPKVIILDDPTVYLDNKNKMRLSKLLKKLKNNYHKTIILFTDDLDFVFDVSDNFLLLKKGKVVSSGNKKDLLNSGSKIKNAGIEVPKIIDFINNVKKKKNVDLELTFDIKELMKDIYRNVK